MLQQRNTKLDIAENKKVKISFIIIFLELPFYGGPFTTVF